MNLRARITGANEAASRVLRVAGELRKLMEDTLEGLGDDAELIYAAHAPHGASGRTARGITAQRSGLTVLVRGSARNPATGYDYFAVTRFGQRGEWIVPRADRASASVIATGRKRARAGTTARPALRFTIGGRVLYRARVKAYHPAGDWTDRALPDIRHAADEAMRVTGRKIEVLAR